MPHFGLTQRAASLFPPSSIAMISKFHRPAGVSRRAALTALTGAALVAASPLAQANTFPTKPITIVVGFPAGGAADLLARLVAERLGSLYQQPVIVENKPGAGSTLGAAFVAKAPADGHTLLLGVTASQTIAPSIYPKLPYSADKDFAPITLLAQIPVALVVHPSLDAGNPADLVKLARKASSPMAFASSGAGAIPHLTAEVFKSTQKLDLMHIPYRGAAPAMTDLISGRVHIMFDHLPTVLPHIKTGKLRALGVASNTRAQAVSDLPTLTEAGVPGVEVSSWFGLLAPAGTPPEIIKQLNADVVKLINQPASAEKFVAMGAERLTGTPEAFASVIRADTLKWTRIVKETGAKLE
jgi:tripartite-type tricarboxylate transporter receptor subunit TctC